MNELSEVNVSLFKDLWATYCKLRLVHANASVCVDIQYHYYANNDVDYLEEEKKMSGLRLL